MKQEEIKKAVRDRYAEIAVKERSCCPSASCGGGKSSLERISKGVGYSPEEILSAPEGSNLGLGCGNPTALASLRENEVVVDLGSGAGFDCFLAAKRVGEGGKVIGVDMTSEMLDKARKNVREGGYRNVEFRLGEIENLPVADESADVIISNCVINLSPDKKRVFEEAFRILKPGGRLMVSDIVLLSELPEAVKESIEAYVGCLAGAVMKNEYLGAISEAGFQDVKIAGETPYPVKDWAAAHPESELSRRIGGEKLTVSIASIKVRALKPGPGARRA